MVNEFLKTNKLVIEMIIGIIATWLTYIYTNSAFTTAVIASIGFVVFYFINKSIESKEKNMELLKERFIALQNKYGTEPSGFDEPNYFGYIAPEFTKTEIDFLIKKGLLNKSDYDTYKSHLNSI